MSTPQSLFLISCAGLVAAVFAGEGALTEWVALAVLTAFASGLIWLWSLRRPRAPASPAKRADRILVDGSNVMYWQGDEPKIETLRIAVAALSTSGKSVGIIFDASAGYRLAGRYLGEAELAAALGLPLYDVFVVPKGSVADEYLLKAARQMGAAIVTNDRYRDWAHSYPEVRVKGRLIGGRVVKGELRLENR